MRFQTGGIELLDAIEAMWSRLNDHHVDCSTHFSRHFREGSFSEYKDYLIARSRGAEIRVEIALHPAADLPAGFSVVWAERTTGFIHSLFVEEAYRSRGIGGRLMERALAWLESQNAENRTVGVALGNDRAFSFYERFGFLPRLVFLQQKTEME